MIVDRALADAQVCGDVFAGMTGKDEVQDLPLTRRQTAYPYHSRLPCRFNPALGGFNLRRLTGV
jgi:hypothetical protein